MTSRSNDYPSWSREQRRARSKKHYWDVIRPKKNVKYCSLCGEVLRGGGKSWEWGFHRKCDPNKYAKLLYESRKDKT